MWYSMRPSNGQTNSLRKIIIYYIPTRQITGTNTPGQCRPGSNGYECQRPEARDWEKVSRTVMWYSMRPSNGQTNSLRKIIIYYIPTRQITGTNTPGQCRPGSNGYECQRPEARDWEKVSRTVMWYSMRPSNGQTNSLREIIIYYIPTRQITGTNTPGQCRPGSNGYEGWHNKTPEIKPCYWWIIHRTTTQEGVHFF